MSLRSHEDKKRGDILEQWLDQLGRRTRFQRKATRSTFEATESQSLDRDPTTKAQCARREPLAMGRTFADPQTGVAKGRTLGRNMRSKCRCSMCPAIHINSRSWLRSSSTHEPSDPLPKVITLVLFFTFHDTGQTGEANPESAQIDFHNQMVCDKVTNEVPGAASVVEDKRVLFKPLPRLLKGRPKREFSGQQHKAYPA